MKSRISVPQNNDFWNWNPVFTDESDLKMEFEWKLAVPEELSRFMEIVQSHAGIVQLGDQTMTLSIEADSEWELGVACRDLVDELATHYHGYTPDVTAHKPVVK